MMRFVLSLLILHFSIFSLMSCTSQETSDSAAAVDESGSGAIDESDLAEGSSANQPTTPDENSVESDLESGEQKVADTQVQEKPTETENEGSLEDELAKSGDQEKVNQPTPPAEEPAQVQPPVATVEPPAPPPPPVSPPPEPMEVKPELAKIRDIRYLSNPSGGTVVIETTKPVTYQTRMNHATQQFVIEIAEVELPASLQRPFRLNEMGSKIGGINAYQSENSKTARVVVQLSGAIQGEPVVQQEGTSLVVIPPAAPVIAEKPTPPSTVVQPPSTKITSSEGPLSARTLDEFLTGNQRFFGAPISLQVKDADIRDVVNFIAEDSGANIVMSDDVVGKISLKLRKIPWDQALVTVMRSKGLGYTRQGNVLRISTLNTLQGETEAANKILEAQKAIVPAVVQVVPASYANIEDLVKSVTPFLSATGKVVADVRTNTLIVTDKSEVVERIQKLVKTLDIIPPQVSIESKIVEAVEGFENFVGVNWTMSGSPITLSSSGGAYGAPITLTPGARSATLSQDFAGATPLSARLGIGTIDAFGDLAATLQLAEHDSLAKVISAPRISTMNREKSTITQQGENVSVVTTRSEQSGAVTKAEKRTPFSLELNVTPQITPDGSVIMDLDVTRQFLGSVVDQETQARPVNTRKAKTKILVRNGQTAVIGGIYTSDETEAVNGVPGLMNIPVLGWLFKNKSSTRSKNELLIFMTPRILAADGSGAEANSLSQ